MIYNVVLVSAIRHSESVYVCTHISPLFFRLSSHIGHYRLLSRVPCAISRFVLAIYFIYSSVYMSIPISQFIPPPLSPLVTISLFSTSVTLFLFCKFICNIFLDSTYKRYHMIFIFLCLTYFTQYDHL